MRQRTHLNKEIMSFFETKDKKKDIRISENKHYNMNMEQIKKIVVVQFGL